ncbi:hypothetical protein SBADM41S_00260 [Streptomyces badius]
MTDAVLAAVEQAVDAFAEGFERAQRLTVRREEAARREFIDDLLYGRSDLVRLAERATRFGLRLSRAHAVAVASGPEAYTETDAVPRSVEAALLTRFSGRKILLRRRTAGSSASRRAASRTSCATSPAGPRGDGRRAVAGRPHGPRVVHSYDEALEALDLANRMGMEDPVLYASDLLVYPVLTRDRQAMADLAKHASRTTACSVASKSPSAPPMTMPIWMTARASASLLRLGDLLDHTDLAKGEVGGELVDVRVEAPLEVVGGEVSQDVVGRDERRDALALGRVDGTVGGGHQGAHGHARVAERPRRELVLLRLQAEPASMMRIP